MDDSFMRQNLNQSLTSRVFFVLLVMSVAPIVFMSVDACAQTVGESHFPYQAIVLNDGAMVRSGPAKVHYATGKLSQNDSVEVYRHDPGGWCAIRPLDGSFSLIPESAVAMVDSGVGEIKDDGTQAWVGTGLGPVEKPLWQIKLKRGEKVEILGTANWPNPAGHSTMWYQIAPPAGEFRWIHISDLQVPPTLGELFASNLGDRADTTQITPRQSGNRVISLLDQKLRTDSNIRAATYQSAAEENTSRTGSQMPFEFDNETLNRPPSNQGWRQASQPASRDRFRDREPEVPYKADSSSMGSQNTYSSNTNSYSSSNFSGSTSNRTDAPRRLASSRIDPRFDLENLRGDTETGFNGFGNNGSTAQTLPLSNRLAGLELKLNNEMIKDPDQWRLIDLETVANSIYESTDDPLERLQAQRLLAKLENCRQIRTGYAGVKGTSPSGGGMYSNSRVGTGVASEEEFSLSTLYDATGWLNELVRNSGSSQSTYVLQNDSGKITHHIAAAPGLNLHRYIKTKIGVKGQRGYHKELNLNHVTAEEVIELKKR